MITIRGIHDYYVINASDGSRKLIRQKQRGGVSLSPGAKYAIFFDGKDWNSYSVADGRVVNLTKSLGVNFYNEDNDSPDLPGSYGIAGWTKDDREVLIYDRYDVWVVSPDGSGAKNLTDGVGRREKLRLPLRASRSERALDRSREATAAARRQRGDARRGFYRERIGGGLPEKLLMGAKGFNNPTKAKDADVLMFTASRFDEFPDVWVTDINFKNLAEGQQRRRATRAVSIGAQPSWSVSRTPTACR